MPNTSSPLLAAQEQAANADEALAQGLLIPSAEAHHKAAQAYQECVDASSDESAKTTLRRLAAHHAKQAADLDTRIAQLRKDGVDPARPQKPHPRSGATSIPPHMHPGPSASPPPHGSRNRLSDSQHTVDESFMLLGQQSADAGDAFNHFWKAMERLDVLAQPVAFATASLGLTEPNKGHSSQSSTESDDSDLARSKSNRKSRKPARDDSFATAHEGEMGRSVKASVVDLKGEFDEIAEEDYDSSDSFCFIPSKSEPNPGVLKAENEALKDQVTRLQSQLASAQRTLQQRTEQDQALRDNIALARREAQRAMGASLVAGRSGVLPPQFGASLHVPAINVQSPSASSSTDKRVKELEEEVKVVREELRAARVENEKQKAMIAKFRERWDKLKESAKRKREAKAKDEQPERIVEEPEAEAAAEAGEV
ncbi:hypothetical protein PENSPDRAFT_631685 [Peniophora sp. CONT]|nr:hypothetical protein PENSPDRAFT_631685 [Peniophora sp. CONT]